MNTPNLSEKKITLRQANQMLPLVQSITTDIVELTAEVRQTRERLGQLGERRIGGSPQDIYRTEVLSIEKIVLQQTQAIDAYILELVELGLRPTRVTDGFVDFPARRQDESVCLCWKSGEADVRYWHRATETCEQRQLVDLELIRQSGDHAFV